MSDDRRMGYPPAADWHDLEVDCFPLGIPVRIEQDWQQRALDLFALERKRERLGTLILQTMDCMTQGDQVGFKAQGRADTAGQGGRGGGEVRR